MSQPSTASDLVQIALAVLQPGAATAEPRPAGSFPRSAVLELSALLCAAAALGCGLVALWIYASPMLGAAGALLVVSGVLCVVGFAAFVFERRARDRRATSPPPSLASGFADDALLAGGSRPPSGNTPFSRSEPLSSRACSWAGKTSCLGKPLAGACRGVVSAKAPSRTTPSSRGPTELIRGDAAIQQIVRRSTFLWIAWLALAMTTSIAAPSLECRGARTLP